MTKNHKKFGRVRSSPFNTFYTFCKFLVSYKCAPECLVPRVAPEATLLCCVQNRTGGSCVTHTGAMRPIRAFNSSHRGRVESPAAVKARVASPMGAQLVLVWRQADCPTGIGPKNGTNTANIGPKPPKMLSKFINELVPLSRKVTTFQVRV